MKNILIPTDFSFASVNAVNHASKWLEDGGTITLLHVYHPSLSHAEMTAMLPKDDLLDEHKSQLEKFKHEVHKINPNTVFNTIFELGFAVEKILEVSKTGEYDALFMGTSGAGGVLEQLLGSVSIEVAQKSTLPLWLIPPKSTPREIRKIVYAYNGEDANEALLVKAVDIAQEYNAAVDFVNVIGEHQIVGDYIVTDILHQISEKVAAPLNYNVVTVSSDSGWHGILEHSRLQAGDLIVIGAKQRNWYERLFHRSFTKNIILEDKDVPLLVLRTEN